MLKRQRPVSPPPTFSSVPLVIADPPVDFMRNSKRRRTIPPVLDGASRGWAQAPPLSINVEDEDDEDYISDGEIENIAPNFSINCSLTQPEDRAEYTSTNSFLRELHVLQQRRLLSSLLPPSASASSSSFLYGSDSKDVQASNILPYSGYPPLTKGLPPQPRVPSHMPPTPIAKLSQQQSHGLPIDEIHNVTEHYEGTNKFLGSLFLSRRRVLCSSAGS